MPLREPDAAEEATRLRALIEASPLGLSCIEGGRITLASRVVEEVTGYRAGELLGQSPRLLYFSDAEHQAARQTIQDRLARDGACRLEVRLRHRDGREIWARLSCRPLDPARPEVGFCLIAEDITQQRRNAVELETIVKATPMAVACVVDRRYVWTNPAFETLTGYTSAELRGQSTRIAYESDEAFESFGRQYYPAIQAGETIRAEVTLVANGGRRMLCEIFGRALELEHPERGAIFLYRDIGEHKATEAALRAGKLRLRALIDGIPDMAWLKDRDGRFLAVNLPLAQYCRRPPEDIVGQLDADVFPKAIARRYRVDDEKVMETRATIRFDENYTDREGRSRWLEVIKVPLFDDDGKVVGTAGIARDITERHEMEGRVQAQAEKLAEQNALLLSANRAKSDFLSTMQHELKTPLNAIIGFAELLAQGIPQPLPPEQQAFAQDVLDAGRHLLELINNILTYTRGESGELTLHLEPLDAQAFLHGCMEAFRKDAEAKSIGLTLSVAADCGTFNADRQYLRKILDNLLSNAIKFTPTGGQVMVTTRIASGRECGKSACDSAGQAFCARCLQIAVADTGIGIAEKDTYRVFQPFLQLKSGLTRPAGGTGLGLALSRRLAELHGGTLDFVSGQGQGSTFTLTLPWQPIRQKEAKEYRP